MEEEYLIEEVFLETDAPDTAEIEIEESNFANFIIQSENTNIETEMIISGVGGEEPSLLQYMRLIDYVNTYSKALNEKDYTIEEVTKVERLLNHFNNLKGVEDKDV